MTADVPSHVLLILSYRCNLRCPYCLVFDPVRYWRADPTVELPPARVERELRTQDITERLIPQFEDAGVQVVALTGGEVMIRRDARDIFAALGRSTLRWCLDTNLSFCNASMADAIIDADCDTVFASLDGPEDVHNRLRASKRAYGDFRRGLELLLARRRGTAIHLNCVLQAGNEHVPPQLVAFAADIGADEIAFQLLSALRYQPGFNAQLAAESLREAELLAASRGVRLSEYPIPQPTVAQLEDWFRPEPTLALFQGCSYIHNTLRVDPAGNVIPCVEHGLGNLMEQDLLNIWHGEAFTAWRQRVQRQPIDACRRCCNMDSAIGDNPSTSAARPAASAVP